MSLLATAPHSQRLSYEPLTPAHAQEVYPTFSDARLYTFIGGAPTSVQALQDRYARMARGGSADGTERWLNWIVRDKATAHVVGWVQATVTGERASIAWLIVMDAQGFGFAKEAAAALVEALASEKVTRVEACVHPDHIASERVAAHAGLSLTDKWIDGERMWAAEITDLRTQPSR